MSDFEPVVYVKGDDERVADSPAKAVKLAWDGFKPKQADQVEEPAEGADDNEGDEEDDVTVANLDVPNPSPSLFR